MSSEFEDLREMLSEGYEWNDRRSSRLNGRFKFFWRVLYAVRFVAMRI